MSEFYIECPEGQEQGPAIEGVEAYCVLADEANPGEVFPDPLPLETQPAPFESELGAPRELAETGPVDPLTILVVGVIVLLAGVATWLTRTKEKED